MSGNYGGGGRDNRRLGVSAQGGISDEDKQYGQGFPAGVEVGTFGISRDDI